jgi:hypothetical protein
VEQEFANLSDLTFIDRIHGGLGFLLLSAILSVGGGVLLGVIVQTIGEPAGFIGANATFELMVGSSFAMMAVCLTILVKYPARFLAYGAAAVSYASWLALFQGGFDLRAAGLGVGVGFVVALGLSASLWMLRAVLGPHPRHSPSYDDNRYAARRHLAIVTAFAVVIALGTTYALFG